MKKVIKGITTHTIAFVLGAIAFIVTGVYAAPLINGKEVTYDNTNSKLEATNTQDAIDELYNLSKKRKNIITGYTYNQTSGSSNCCVTGNEGTCVETTCYEKTTAGSCPAGTIIDYMVNDKKVVRFHSGAIIDDIHTENGAEGNYGYWTMSVHSGGTWCIHTYGVEGMTGISTVTVGARAVVEVNK